MNFKYDSGCFMISPNPHLHIGVLLFPLFNIKPHQVKYLKKFFFTLQKNVRTQFQQKILLMLRNFQ